MKLDETILQSNTCIELIKYIKELRKNIENSTGLDVFTIPDDTNYNYIMKKTGKALIKRSRGYQITDIFTNKEINELKLERLLKRRERMLLRKKMQEVDNKVMI